jgi:heme/copper-type cytochrome/quinol oxidase subunit 3
MDTTLEHAHEEHAFELEPHVKVARARAGVLMLILSDALVFLAIMAGAGYLRALNTEGQYHVATDFAPAFLPGLLVAIGAVLSGLAFFMWERKARIPGAVSQPLFLWLAFVLMLAAGVGDTVLAASLRYGFQFSAYESLQLLITWFTALHLLLAAVIGLLVGGRMLRGRLAGHEFIVEVTSYWWYYTVFASVLLWLFAVYLT